MLNKLWKTAYYTLNILIINTKIKDDESVMSEENTWCPKFDIFTHEVISSP